MKTDIEIANESKMLNINEIGKLIDLQDELIPYGKYKAKISEDAFKKIGNKKKSKLVLVTATSPTKAGEGKTTITIGLSMALNKLGKKTTVALREPSLGPCFGMKGGACGGGYSQVLPMDEINLHFTGDIHAVGLANNLLASMIDNHIFFGNSLGIDNVTWRRCFDVNDRALREIVINIGGKVRTDHFNITAASEIMAILCLASDIDDLHARLKRIIIGYDFNKNAVTAGDLNADGSMLALLKDAFLPNLVQTTENTQAIIHGGPFANIAHGCNSIRATNLAMSLSEIVITEAGFGADLGAEKFFDIKCRQGNLVPDACVLVTTIKSIKFNCNDENGESDLSKGICNLEKHIENLQKFGVPIVVALNKYLSDTDEEIAFVKSVCEQKGVDFAQAEVWEHGGNGGLELSEAVVKSFDKPNNFKFLYELDETIEEKITKIAKEIYGAKNVVFSAKAKKEIANLERLGLANLPICMAKNQYSFSDDQKLLGRPTGFTTTIKDVSISAGAGFIVAYTSVIMTMPGLPKVPAAENISLIDGNIVGLF